MLLALPIGATGCRTASSGWGWSPSFSSLNPWKSSSTNTQLASSKPSSQVPTPPATMLAGSGLARNGANSGGAPTYNANTYPGARPTNGATASTNDYGSRQTSATLDEGYPTGRYNTGSGTAQHGPYGAGATAYGSANGPAASTADHRSDPAYGASNNGWQNYNNKPQNNPMPANQPQNNPYQNAPNADAYQGAAATQSNIYAGGTKSAYAGTMGQSTGTSRSSSPAAAYGGDAYRPGSTARATEDVQRASFDNAGSSAKSYEGNYPTTSASDDSTYR